mmetsp:Transcript_29547/g.33998  ORF Transcript_29547/g.33998 Transcript_29547/m.33998 type:complete len:262 (+) Transcript_29547:47-832(+)
MRNNLAVENEFTTQHSPDIPQSNNAVEIIHPSRDTNIYGGWEALGSDSNNDGVDDWKNEGDEDANMRAELDQYESSRSQGLAHESSLEDGKDSESSHAPSSAAASPVVQAAGVVGIVTGAVIAGPVVGVAAGIGAAYVAASQDNTTGEMARAVGEVVSSVGDRALKMEETHQVITRTKERLDSTVKRVVESEGTKEIFDNAEKATKAAVDVTEKTLRSSWRGIMQFNEKHQVSFKTTQLAARGAYFLAGRLRGGNEPSNEE